MKKPRVFISILHYNKPEETTACLRSLNNLSTRSCELFIILIDNASKEKFVLPNKGVEKLDIELVVIDKNVGFAGGHNRGIQRALDRGADFVMILNNDTTVHEDLIEELLKPFSDEKVGMTVPKIYFTKGQEYHKDRYKKEELGKVIWYAGGITDWDNVISSHRGVDEVDQGQYDKAEDTEFATGACILTKREVYEKIGVFDERYFLYYEDGDLNMRVKKAGYKIMFTPRAVLWHNNASTTGGSGSVLQDYYITRNRLLFGITYAPLRAKVALLRESLRILRSGRKWQKRGVIDYYLRRFGRGSFQ